MKKDRTNQDNLNNQFIKRYLWVFLVYISITLIIAIYISTINYLYGQQDWEFSLTELLFTINFFGFNIYNIMILIKIIKRKLPKSYLFLSLSEFLPFFYIAPFTFIDVILHIGLPRIDFLTGEIFNNSLKFLQLVFIIYLLLKIYKTEKK